MPGKCRTFKGTFYDPLNMKIEDIDIEVIAKGLSSQNRYLGQCEPFYDTGLHSIHVASMLPHPFGIHGLIHDGPEAYIGDMTSHLKHDPSMSGFAKIDDYILDLIWDKYDLWPKEGGEAEAERIKHVVKVADILSYQQEKVNLFDIRHTGGWSEWDTHPRYSEALQGFNKYGLTWRQVPRPRAPGESAGTFLFLFEQYLREWQEYLSGDEVLIA